MMSTIDIPQKSDNELRILAVTFNMAGGCPDTPKVFDDLFQKDNIDHDIIVLGTQEAVRPIAASLFLPGKEQLNNMVKKYLNDVDNNKENSKAEKGNDWI